MVLYYTVYDYTYGDTCIYIHIHGYVHISGINNVVSTQVCMYAAFLYAAYMYVCMCVWMGGVDQMDRMA